MCGFERLAILVDPEEADVEVEAGELEVIDITAKAGDGFLRGEDEPDIGVLLVTLEVIEAALVERDDIAA